MSSKKGKEDKDEGDGGLEVGQRGKKERKEKRRYYNGGQKTEGARGGRLRWLPERGKNGNGVGARTGRNQHA